MANTEIATISTEPNKLMQLALEHGAGIDVIERLAKLQCDMLDRQAKIEFNEAMQRAQEKMKRIGTDALNPQTHSRYATYAKLDKALRPIYSEEGFSLSFNTGESHLPEHMRVMCDVSRGSHVKTYQIDIPTDGKGPKGNDVMSKTHAAGSAGSYGMRYLLKMIFNVAVGETDDDGNMGINETVEAEYGQRLKDAKTLEELQKEWRVVAAAIISTNDKDAGERLTQIKEQRKAELRANS